MYVPAAHKSRLAGPSGQLVAVSVEASPRFVWTFGLRRYLVCGYRIEKLSVNVPPAPRTNWPLKLVDATLNLMNP